MSDSEAEIVSGHPPRRMDRRTFVKRTVGTAAAGATAASGLGLIAPASTTLGIKIPRFPYLGAKKVGGPAPKGLPPIPVRIDAEGFLVGVPDRLDWYKYCSHQAAPGLQPGFTQDNRFYVFANPDQVRMARDEGIDLWYERLEGQPLHVSQFDEVGKGAPFRWRSEGQVDTNVITGLALRLDPARMTGEIETLAELMDLENGLIAFCTFCAHFCCVPSYRVTNDSRRRNAWDRIHCTCHHSIYDPYELKRYMFPPNRSW